MLEKGWYLASQLASFDRLISYNRDDLKNVYSDLSDCSISSGPVNSKTKVGFKSRKVEIRSFKHNPRSFQPDKGKDAGHGKIVLEATSELLREQPKMRELIINASRRHCPIVGSSMEMFALLASRSKILNSPANINVLTVEDMLSILPG